MKSYKQFRRSPEICCICQTSSWLYSFSLVCGLVQGDEFFSSVINFKSKVLRDDQ